MRPKPRGGPTTTGLLGRPVAWHRLGRRPSLEVGLGVVADRRPPVPTPLTLSQCHGVRAAHSVARKTVAWVDPMLILLTTTRGAQAVARSPVHPLVRPAYVAEQNMLSMGDGG
eukprot:6212951-Pleurochrysis_carterae.AAC.2